MSTKHGTSAYPCGKYGTVQVQVLSASAQCKSTVQVQVLIPVDNVEESGRGRGSLVNTSTPPPTYFEAWYLGFQ